MSAHWETIVPVQDRARVKGVIRGLRETGLSYLDIARVVALYEGYEITERQVQAQCFRMGMPRRESMVRVPA